MTFKTEARFIAQLTGMDYAWWRVRAMWTKVKNRRNVNGE